MDVGGRLGAAGDVEVAAARGAGADEDRVPAFGEQRLEAVDALAGAEIDAEIEDVVAFLVDHRFRADGSAGSACGSCRRLGVGIEHDTVVAERRKIARDGERGGAAAHQRDALAVLVLGRARQARLDVALVVRGDALEPADRDRLVLDAAAPAGGLARPVAGAAENARETRWTSN